MWAQAHGKRVAAHARSAEAVKMCLRHGVDVIYHATLLDDEARDQLEAQRERVFVAPVLGNLYATLNEAAAWGITREMAEERGIAHEIEEGIGNMRALHKRGVRVLIGGDYGFAWNPIGTDARDIGHFVDMLGFSPMDAILAATRLGGQIMGMGDRLGQVRPGYLADLLLVGGDPLEDVSVLQESDRFRAIMKDGAFWNRPDPVLWRHRGNTLHGVARLSMLFRSAIAGIAWMIFSSAAQAQVQPATARDKQDLLNWYYAATFGTGVYTAGDRSVSVLQLPFSRALKTVDQDGMGLKFTLSTTFGFYDYKIEDPVHGNFPDRVSTFSILPGVEWEFPINRRWSVRPYVDAGFGQEFSGRESAWIYDFGIKSRFVLGKDNGVEFALVNSLTSAGYRPRGGPSRPFGYFATGVDLTIPTRLNLFGRDAFIGFTPVYYKYFNNLNFSELNDPQNTIREEFQLAVSLLARKPWSLKLFDVDRIGISVRSSGNVTGVSLFTSLPF